MTAYAACRARVMTADAVLAGVFPTRARRGPVDGTVASTRVEVTDWAARADNTVPAAGGVIAFMTALATSPTNCPGRAAVATAS